MAKMPPALTAATVSGAATRTGGHLSCDALTCNPRLGMPLLHKMLLALLPLAPVTQPGCTSPSRIDCCFFCIQGMDALTHAVEAYVSTISNPITGEGTGPAGRSAH